MFSFFTDVAINYAHGGIFGNNRRQQEEILIQQQKQQANERSFLRPTATPQQQQQQPQSPHNAADIYGWGRHTGGSITGGLSAWAIITIIVIVILIGMAGYYGILCYPLICRSKEPNYYNMDGVSSTSSGGTPTRSTEFEKFDKLGNYSSRSTTPSKSQE